ncbi:hypothetical protein [Jiulongibacter sediminis]|uniref:Uncharacterized protein n=1 Tax=Jiulongibacter sediminis TaxID=1605367 RepID=A0A0P7BFS7_9BACT|nr:hypothetical protein [Jiulongibacter sediminis]KPM49728.1 hypothetical protein AFM12_03865 [Jiulongibacter sediminis]TBX26765.1 hypothetical protein TK44_03870 [Jiulongibacter sediminis]
MRPSFHIDPKLYDELLESLNEMHFTESRGNITDFNIYFDDLWLSDTAVVENLSLVQGMWDIQLLFALSNNPLRFIKRSIVSSPDKKRATLTASLMRRLAAKDQRGTLCIRIEDLNLSEN